MKNKTKTEASREGGWGWIYPPPPAKKNVFFSYEICIALKRYIFGKILTYENGTFNFNGYIVTCTMMLPVSTTPGIPVSVFDVSFKYIQSGNSELPVT